MAFLGGTSSIMHVVQQAPPPPKRPSAHSELNKLPVPSVYSVYPPDPPADVKIPKRVNPLRPDPPERMTCVTETEEPHFHNRQRLQMLQRKQFHRFHHSWSRYYYGAAPEKEVYNRFLREGLKEQMQEIDQRKQRNFQEKSQESSVAVARDQRDIESDQQVRVSKHQLLTHYRDANKSMMEERERQQRVQRLQEKQFDREQLKYNPINWSCSLK